jgi:hypothetical protein
VAPSSSSSSSSSSSLSPPAPLRLSHGGTPEDAVPAAAAERRRPARRRRRQCARAHDSGRRVAQQQRLLVGRAHAAAAHSESVSLPRGLQRLRLEAKSPAASLASHFVTTPSDIYGDRYGILSRATTINCAGRGFLLEYMQRTSPSPSLAATRSFRLRRAIDHVHVPTKFWLLKQTTAVALTKCAPLYHYCL